MNSAEDYAAQELSGGELTASSCAPARKNKTKDIRIKVTEDQHQILVGMADLWALSLQDLIRFQILGPNAAEKLPAHDKLLRLLADLGHVGSNLNQAQRVVNSQVLTEKLSGGGISESTLVDLTDAIKKTGKEVSSFKSKIRKIMRIDGD